MICGLTAALLSLAPASQQRLLEVPLAPLAPEASPDEWMDQCGLPASLRDRLDQVGVDAVVLWLPGSAGRPDWPEEPRARWAQVATLPETTPAPLQALVSDLEGRSLRVAIGRATTSPSRQVLVETAEGDRLAVERLDRPDVSPFLWYDPEWYQQVRRFPDQPVVLDLSSCAKLPEELRATQLFLEMLAIPESARGLDRSVQLSVLLQLPLWRQDVAPPLSPSARKAAAHRLLRQSRLATWLAVRLAPEGADGLRPLRNLRQPSSPASPDRELVPADGLDFLRWSLLPFPAHRDRDLQAGVESVPADATEVPGILGESHLSALEQWARQRWQASRWASRWWLSADSADLAAVRDLILSADRARAGLPEELRPLHRPGVDEWIDLEQAEPFRVFSSQWQLSLADPQGEQAAVATLTLRRSQDHRFDGAAARLLAQEQDLSLRRYWRRLDQRTVVLRTEIPAFQPRTWRLRLGGSYTATVILNGTEVARQQDLAREGGLTLALDLAAALNEVEVRLQARPESDLLRLDWWPVPHALEGLVLAPAQAREIQAPLLQVEHPLALHGTLLVIPRDRPLRPEEHPIADFVFPTEVDRRWDLWVHGSLPAGARDQVTVQVDGRAEEVVPFAPDQGWQWIRMPAPYTLRKGDHQILVGLLGPGVLMDSLHLIPTGSRFPGPPSGDRSLGDHAWRYQPLGRGHRFEIPAFDEPRRLAGTYKTERTGHYRAYVWMKGTRPLLHHQTAEIELATSASIQRVFLGQGTPVEEWVPVGFLDLTAEEPLTLRSRGDGAPAYLCLVPARPSED